MNSHCRTPVVLLIFNRPDVTARVFAAIREAKPERLFVVSDGPRLTHPADVPKVEAARAVTDNVDWDCEVLRLYSDVNLGCRDRVSSGLTAVFKLVGSAIILEDDCLPATSFFGFCEEMLARYARDERIISVGGTSFLPFPRYAYSYKFSKYPHIWGWATWSDRWMKYHDTEIRWKEASDPVQLVKHFCASAAEQEYWRRTFDACFEGSLNSWGYIWLLTSWLANGLNVIPQANLVQNIGFGEDATHTTEGANVSAMTVGEISKIRHPIVVKRDLALDRRIGVVHHGCERPLLRRIWYKILRMTGR